MVNSHFYTKDCPRGRGKTPKPGDREYTFLFPLEDGNDLTVHMGDESLAKFREFLGSMDLDDEAERNNESSKAV